MDFNHAIDLMNLIYPLLLLIGGIFGGYIKKWLMRNEKLSDATLKILELLRKANITPENIAVILGRVSAYNDLDDAGKQLMAREELLKLGKRNGVTIPDSIADDIITWLWVKTKNK